MLNAFIEDRPTRRKEKWRESKSISLFLSRENCHCQYITTHENGRWKWISCLVGRILKMKKSVCDKAIFYLSYNFVLLFRKRLWCFSVRPYVVPFFYGGFGATFRSRQTTKIVFKNIVSSFYYIIMSVFAAATRRRRSLNHHHQCRRRIEKLYYEYGFLHFRSQSHTFRWLLDAWRKKTFLWILVGQGKEKLFNFFYSKWLEKK